MLFLAFAALLLDAEMHVSTGAAAGYVADSECADCHGEQWASYRETGMAQSMRRPGAAARIEDFAGASFDHAPSRRHYQMEWKDGQLVFRRYRLDPRGRKIDLFEQNVDWILGSGYRARVYLYRTPSGELFQLPIAWYAQEKKWGMAPGYDRPDHEGVERRVQRECLFCHNAYPEVPAGSDRHGAPQTFPAELPEGTGCQRCHGPGAKHVRTVLGGGSIDEIRAAIVNPAKLPPEKRDSVCFQCHLLPAVAMPGVRRFDRRDYSFRPGELLSDYMLHVDVDEAGRRPEDRFEINHHAYRLRQSLCYRKGGITCITCHDPHVSPARDKRLANVREVCRGCHEKAHAGDDRKAGDCVRCHMPQRRTQDVVHVIMTDHRIERRPPPGNLLAPLHEGEPRIEKVVFLDPGHAPAGALGDAYRAVTVLRAQPANAAAFAHLKRALAAISDPPKVALDDLVSAELHAHQYVDADRSIARLGEDDPQRLGFRSVARIGIGETEKGLDDLRKAVADAPEVPELHYNLGLVLHQLGKDAEALGFVTRAVQLRPNFVVAWIARAKILARLGRQKEAAADLEKARAIHPGR